MCIRVDKLLVSLEFLMDVDSCGWKIWCYLWQDCVFYWIKNRYYICFFSQLCKNQNLFLWFFPLGEIIIGIKLVFNKYQNHYCYITFFLEKCLYHVAEKWQKTFLQHIDGGIWWDKSSKARRKNKKRDVDVNNMVIIVIQYIWRWKLKKY